MDEREREIAGIIGQWAGALAIIGGVCAEIVYRAHWYLVLITGASLLWGIATKVRGK